MHLKKAFFLSLFISTFANLGGEVEAMKSVLKLLQDQEEAAKKLSQIETTRSLAPELMKDPTTKQAVESGNYVKAMEEAEKQLKAAAAAGGGIPLATLQKVQNTTTALNLDAHLDDLRDTIDNDGRTPDLQTALTNTRNKIHAGSAQPLLTISTHQKDAIDADGGVGDLHTALDNVQQDIGHVTDNHGHVIQDLHGKLQRLSTLLEPGESLSNGETHIRATLGTAGGTSLLVGAQNVVQQRDDRQTTLDDIRAALTTHTTANLLNDATQTQADLTQTQNDLNTRTQERDDALRDVATREGERDDRQTILDNIRAVLTTHTTANLLNDATQTQADLTQVQNDLNTRTQERDDALRDMALRERERDDRQTILDNTVLELTTHTTGNLVVDARSTQTDLTNTIRDLGLRTTERDDALRDVALREGERDDRQTTLDDIRVALTTHTTANLLNDATQTQADLTVRTQERDLANNTIGNTRVVLGIPNGTPIVDGVTALQNTLFQHLLDVLKNQQTLASAADGDNINGNAVTQWEIDTARDKFIALVDTIRQRYQPTQIGGRQWATLVDDLAKANKKFGKIEAAGAQPLSLLLELSKEFFGMI